MSNQVSNESSSDCIDEKLRRWLNVDLASFNIEPSNLADQDPSVKVRHYLTLP